MYPFISDIPHDLFGIELPFPIFSFGAMVAVAIVTAAWLTSRELDRMYRAGDIGPVYVKIKSKNRKGHQSTSKQMASPAVLVSEITMLAAVLGLAGSRLFHILENLDQFTRDPLGMIFSTGGLTFYGGMIVAGLGIAWYAHRKDLPVRALADAVAPGLMLSYGIGRIGCYLAGDGDWGICSSLADKPAWIPDFLWSETFPRNVLGPNRQPIDVLAYMNCPPGADGVYPTMLYEFAMAVILFGILWTLRKHPFLSGWLFAAYLVLNGIERLLIEQIRINNVGILLGLEVTQAEVIAVLIIIVGIVGLVLTSRRRTSSDKAHITEGASHPRVV